MRVQKNIADEDYLDITEYYPMLDYLMKGYSDVVVKFVLFFDQLLKEGHDDIDQKDISAAAKTSLMTKQIKWFSEELIAFYHLLSATRSAGLLQLTGYYNDKWLDFE